MEEGVLNFIFNYIKGLNIPKCDVYLNLPTLVGNNEKRNKCYVVVSFPHGFENRGPFSQADGLITIGAKDAVLGLPQVKEITRVANIIRSKFPILTPEYSFIDMEFSSDESLGTGWHEYYYSFQLYINKSN